MNNQIPIKKHDNLIDLIPVKHYCTCSSAYMHICTWRLLGHVECQEQKHFLTLFSCKLFKRKLYYIVIQHGRLVTWSQTKNCEGRPLTVLSRYLSGSKPLAGKKRLSRRRGFIHRHVLHSSQALMQRRRGLHKTSRRLWCWSRTNQTVVKKKKRERERERERERRKRKEKQQQKNILTNTMTTLSRGRKTRIYYIGQIN